MNNQDFNPIKFSLQFLTYVGLRVRQLLVLVRFSVIQIQFISSHIKRVLVSRMFWGRGGFYRNSFHIIVFVFTISGIVLGLINRTLSNPVGASALNNDYGQVASADIIQQGSSIHSVLAVDPTQPEIQITLHVVRGGELLREIAKRYDVSMDTIRWANSDLISPFSNDIQAGWELRIPEIDGVLYTVRLGQNISDIISLTGGNRSDIIELNELVPPHYRVSSGDKLFIPNGRLGIEEVVVAGIPQGVFTNPLTHPKCKGYRVSRGYLPWHNGVDMARYPGCPVRAVATGEVIFAGWSSLAGFNVRIDHGGGIVTHYYHGSGVLWVKEGERVQQGQEIMMMGTSGNSTGVHLHFSLFKDGVAVNPYGFVPY